MCCNACNNLGVREAGTEEGRNEGFCVFQDEDSRLVGGPGPGMWVGLTLGDLDYNCNSSKHPSVTPGCLHLHPGVTPPSSPIEVTAKNPGIRGNKS